MRAAGSLAEVENVKVAGVASVSPLGVSSMSGESASYDEGGPAASSPTPMVVAVVRSPAGIVNVTPSAVTVPPDGPSGVEAVIFAAPGGVDDPQPASAATPVKASAAVI